MPGRCSKYEGEQSDRHPGPLTWPGLEFPYLGVFNGNYQDDKTFAPVIYFKSKLFNLSDDADRDYYEWVKDRIVNGWFIQYNSVITPKENDNAIVVYVYLEWGQPYLMQLKKSNLEVPNNASTFSRYFQL